MDPEKKVWTLFSLLNMGSPKVQKVSHWLSKINILFHLLVWWFFKKSSKHLPPKCWWFNGWWWLQPDRIRKNHQQKHTQVHWWINVNFLVCDAKKKIKNTGWKTIIFNYYRCWCFISSKTSQKNGRNYSCKEKKASMLKPTNRSKAMDIMDDVHRTSK